MVLILQGLSCDFVANTCHKFYIASFLTIEISVTIDLPGPSGKTACTTWCHTPNFFVSWYIGQSSTPHVEYAASKTWRCPRGILASFFTEGRARFLLSGIDSVLTIKPLNILWSWLVPESSQGVSLMPRSHLTTASSLPVFPCLFELPNILS